MKLFLYMLVAASAIFGVAHAAPKEVDLSTLQTYKFNDLYADMLGIKGKVPPKARIDFEDNLEAMWDKKLSRARGVTKPAEDAAVGVVDYYAKHQTRMTLANYITWVHQDIEGLKKTIDWTGLCGVRLKGKRCETLRAITEKTYGVDLVAYGMTELFPSANGTLNVRLLEVLLRNAGRQYLETIPALYDKYASLGFWQFTQFAVYNVGNQVRGASEINLHVGKAYKIPGSVLKLRNEHHHRAAFMFALSNMKDLIRLMSDREVANLARGHGKHLDELVQFVATAHHLPAPAIRGARLWAANNMKHELRVSLGPKLRKYATKTQGNLEALYKHVKRPDRS